MAKIHPAKPIATAVGPTITYNKSIPFQTGGGHKMRPAKPMVDDSMAGGLRPNKTLIPTMNADKPPKGSKVMGTKKWFTPGEDTSKLPDASEGYMVDRDSVLKDSYEK